MSDLPHYVERALLLAGSGVGDYDSLKYLRWVYDLRKPTVPHPTDEWAREFEAKMDEAEERNRRIRDARRPSQPAPEPPPRTPQGGLRGWLRRLLRGS